MPRMLQLTTKPTRALALLLSPAIVVLVYYSIIRSSSPPVLRAQPAASKSPEPNPNLDLDHDVFPDVVEFRSYNDRENFRRWFTWVAEMQFYNLSDQWNPEQRDCAGLVCFAWRETLRPHDRLWLRSEEHT